MNSIRQLIREAHRRSLWQVLGVFLAAGSATHGVDRVVSAFGWSLVAGLLALPLAGLVGLPWVDGAYWTYERLASEIDHAEFTGKALVL